MNAKNLNDEENHHVTSDPLTELAERPGSCAYFPSNKHFREVKNFL